MTFQEDLLVLFLFRIGLRSVQLLLQIAREKSLDYLLLKIDEIKFQLSTPPFNFLHSVST